MDELKAEAIELERLLKELPESYGFFHGAEMVWIHPGDPQYEEARTSYQKQTKRLFR